MRSRRKTISWSIAFTSTNKIWLRLKHNQDLFWGAKNWVCWKRDSGWGPGSAGTIMVISNYLCTWPTILQLSPWHLLEHSITMTQWVPFWWTDTHEWHCLYIYNPNYNLHNYFVLPSFRTIIWSPLSATRLHPIPSKWVLMVIWIGKYHLYTCAQCQKQLCSRQGYNSRCQIIMFQ